MHPEDVRAYVAECVDVLSERLAGRPDLGGPPVLEGFDLYIPFEKVDRQLIDHAVDSDLRLPDGQQVAVIHRVPLLGQAPTIRELVLHMDLADYDAQPPTAQLLLPDRSPLPVTEWPKSIHGQGIVLGHRDFPRPFFCQRGLREFHTHPQHEDDPWDRYREGLALHQVVFELLDGLNNKWIGR